MLSFRHLTITTRKKNTYHDPHFANLRFPLTSLICYLIHSWKDPPNSPFITSWEWLRWENLHVQRFHGPTRMIGSARRHVWQFSSMRKFLIHVMNFIVFPLQMSLLYHACLDYQWNILKEFTIPYLARTINFTQNNGFQMSFSLFKRKEELSLLLFSQNAFLLENYSHEIRKR